MLYPNLAFGKYSIVPHRRKDIFLQRKKRKKEKKKKKKRKEKYRTQGKNSSNGQGKLIQKDNHYLVCQENQNMES